jgi:hypothetical protein
LANVILTVIGIVFGGLVLLGVILLFIRAVRNGQIPWRRALQIGVLVGIAAGLSGLNRLPTLYASYNTSMPLGTFRLFLAVGLVVTPLVLGLLAWLATGLVLSLYPNAWAIFSGRARRAWRRDAILLIALGGGVAAGLSQTGALISDRFHSFMPVRVSLVPDQLDSALPGAGFFLHALMYGVLYIAGTAVLIYMAREGWTRRAWWSWLGVVLLLVALGPTEAHSVREFVTIWAMNLVVVAIATAILIYYFRDNLLAYVGTIIVVPLIESAVDLFRQPLAFYRWNGVILAVLLGVLVAWMLFPRMKAQGDLG